MYTVNFIRVNAWLCVYPLLLCTVAVYIKHVVEVSCAAAQGKVLVNALFIYWLVQYGNVSGP